MFNIHKATGFTGFFPRRIGQNVTEYVSESKFLYVVPIIELAEQIDSTLRDKKLFPTLITSKQVSKRTDC